MAEQSVILFPPVYRVEHYALAPRKRIEEWTYIKPKGKALHEDIVKHFFMGIAVLSRGESNREVAFPLPAASIHHAAALFDEAMQEEIKRLNDTGPKILVP